MKEKMIDKGKTIIYITANVIYRILYSFMIFFPIKSNRIFVNVYDGRGIGDHPKYIIQELNKINSNIDVVWYARKENTDLPITFCKPNGIRALYFMATSKVWIATVRMPLYIVKKRRQYYIQTWHGSLPLKHIEKDCATSLSERYVIQAKHDSKMIDVFISNSKFRTNNFKTAFWYSGDVWEIGSPRDSIFFDPRIKEGCKERHGLSDRKIILYAPTFRGKTGTGNLDIDYLTIKRVLEEKTNESWTVIVRLHPKIADITDDLSLPDGVIDMSKVKDPQEVLVMADIVLTDYSGLMFDAMQADIPVLLYANDIDSYNSDRGFYFSFDELPFLLATNNNQLIDNLLKFNIDEYRESATKFSKKVGIIKNSDASKIAAERVNSIILDCK
jgi:CDP-glycerol glycerophosphotransferase|nr:CDP-glycerol glycerophosphotransferase family protein [uncultured Acetatifactor sp.]